MVEIEDGGCCIEEQESARDARFLVRHAASHEEEDAPEKAYHHRNGYEELVQHAVCVSIRVQRYKIKLKVES